MWEYNGDPWPQADKQDEGKADRRPQRWMYWLHCASPRDRMYTTATRSDTATEHVIDLDTAIAFPEDFTVYYVDTTASRFHGASIAGLVVGAMGCFIFGLYLRRWLRERKALASEPQEDMIA